MVDRSHLVVVGSVVVLAVALSASIGTTAGEPDPDELLEKAVDSLENESIEAVHTQTITKPDGNVSQTVAIHRGSSKSGYLEILESSDNSTRQQMVFDGTSSQQRILNNGSSVRYDGLGEFWFDEFRTLGASPEEVRYYSNEYKGTAEVNGREAYVVEMRPPQETTAALSIDIDAGNVDYHVPLHEATKTESYFSRETWWIDAETYYPIKQTVKWTDRNGNVLATATREYEQLVVGSSVEHTVPQPDGADEPNPEVIDVDSTPANIDPNLQPNNSQYIDPRLFSTYRATNVSVPFDLPTVDVPADYSFDRATVESHNDTHVAMLLYTEADTGAVLSVQVSQGNGSLFYHNLRIHREPISAFDGELVVTDTGTEVVRRCDDLTYRVRGPPAADALIDVAKAIEC